jgi:hypothetical protein
VFCQPLPKYTSFTSELKFSLLSTATLDNMLLKQVMVSLLSSISVDDQTVATHAKCHSVVTNSTQIINVSLKLKSVSQATVSEVFSFKKKLENFKWKTHIFLQSSN